VTQNLSGTVRKAVLSRHCF